MTTEKVNKAFYEEYELWKKENPEWKEFSKMKTPEDDEFERIEAESGWRKRQIALDQKVENAKELGLNYEREPRWKEWRGLTEGELKTLSEKWKIIYGAYVIDFAEEIEAVLKSKNT